MGFLICEINIWDQILCSPDWPLTHDVAEDDPPNFTFQVLEFLAMLCLIYEIVIWTNNNLISLI